jgi:hypothetical protein
MTTAIMIAKQHWENRREAKPIFVGGFQLYEQELCDENEKMVSLFCKMKIKSM